MSLCQSVTRHILGLPCVREICERLGGGGGTAGEVTDRERL